jgi:4-coumarate--CoA ligase
MATGTFNQSTKIWTGDVGAYRYPMDIYLGEKLLEAFDQTPDRILQINHEEGTSQTCQEVKLASIRVAQNLRRLGIQSDDVIGFVCRNSSTVNSLIYGCVLIGAPINPLHVSFTKDKIRHMFRQTKPVLVFCDHDVFETTKEALLEMKSSAMIFTLLKKIPVVPFVNELLIPTGSEYHYKTVKFEKRASEKLLAIVCSSETMGIAKGVCMPHTAVLTYIDIKCKSIKEFRSLNFSSIYWCTGLIGIYLAPFRSGETRISTIKSFNAELCVKLIEQYRASVVVMPPTYLNSLINSPLSSTGDFSSILLFSCTGSVVTENLREKFKERFPNKPLLISYGTTEVLIAAMFPGESNDGLKVGKTFTNIQLKVVDEEGNALGLGEVGEILVKPEFKFLGYYNSPETTQQAVDRDGFLKTGDKGYLDKDGYVYILDRNKDIFKYKEHLVSFAKIKALN